MFQNQITLFDINLSDNIGNWYVVDDGVMGGLSTGKIALKEDECIVYSGQVSLKNNGGFSSIRYPFEKLDIGDLNTITLRLKGDGKNYQFRVKTNRYDRHSYTYNFQTTGQWETVRISLNQLIPTFRGRRLAMENFDASVLSEIGILIGNKKEEPFRLEIEQILIQ